jgi:hypothetical protein
VAISPEWLILKKIWNIVYFIYISCTFGLNNLECDWHTSSFFWQYDRRGDPVVEEEHGRTKTKCTFRRTFREFTNSAPETAMFDTYSNDLWATRHAALGKFAQAARKVKYAKEVWETHIRKVFFFFYYFPWIPVVDQFPCICLIWKKT